MSNSREPCGDANLRREIEEYADGLINLLGNNIGVITDSADPIGRTLYSGAMLGKHALEMHADWQSRSSLELFRLESPLPEDKLFEDWREAGYDHPLLIAAPAGSGKSCLLESFALRMAQDVCNPRRWPVSEPLPPAVPLVVSLKYVGDSSIEDYLPRAGRELAPPLPSLSPEALLRLRREQRLVLLLDGLDEVPATATNLWRQIKLLGNRYLLTTRPGYGEDRLGDARCQRRSLNELTEERARTYVEKYFELFPCSKRSAAQALESWQRDWSTSFGRLLRRPMYLKAWCDFVHDRLLRGATPVTPESLHDLAHLLLRQAIAFRPQSRQEFGDDFDVELDGFIRWFGGIGREFANEGFGELTRAELAKKGVLLQKGDVERTARERRWEQVALRCGWLIYSKANDAYWIPKVPLVEYQIGKALADDAVQHPESPRLLIETFRRWLWRPFLHDILDYTFDALWGTDRAEVRSWADVLLEWVRSAEDLEGVGHGPLNPPAEEDLLNPFLISLIRWRKLQSTANSEAHKTSLEQVARKIAQALRPAVERGAPIGRLIDGVAIVGDDLVFPVQQGLCEQFRLATGNLGLRLAWRSAIWSSANLQCGPEPLDRVRDLVEEYRLAAGDFDLQLFWQHPIECAAGGVRKTEVAGVVKTWMEQYWLATGHPEAQVAWHFAIRSAAKRASEAVAGIVSNLIGWLELETDPAWHDAWRRAISYTVERMNEAESVLARDFIEQYRFAGSGSAVQTVWRFAVWSAAVHLGEADAVRLLSDGIEQHGLAERNSDAQSIWRHAIHAAATRIAEAQAASVVKNLIEQYRLSAGNPDAQADWRQAILSVAGRVGEAEAASVVRDLTEQHRLAEGDPNSQDDWSAAITLAARRVGKVETAGVVRDWMKQHRSAEEGSVAQTDWRKPIESAASRVGETNEEHLEASVAVGTCNRFLANGMSDAAFQVAANNPNVAIVWRTNREDDSPDSPDVEAVLRRNLVLDPAESFAPPAVKAALTATQVSALENSTTATSIAEHSSVVLDAGGVAGSAGATTSPDAAGRRRGVGCLDPLDEDRIKGLFGLLAEWDFKLDNQDRELINLVFSETATRIEDETDRFLFRTYYLFVAFLKPLARLLRLDHVPDNWSDFFDALFADRKRSECRLGKYANFFGEPHLTSSSDDLRRLGYRVAKERFPRLFAMLEEHNRIARLGR